ncbi:hypothetical protein, partial [Agrobacterium tumefaciens]|uniref:hypothetical protein n=1 Tax=Agrobacterium tumefaciens TaxID=358 RepID=UPI003BA3C318
MSTSTESTQRKNEASDAASDCLNGALRSPVAPAVPDSIVRLIQDYGDSLADDDKLSVSKFASVIRAIRA